MKKKLYNKLLFVILPSLLLITVLLLINTYKSNSNEPLMKDNLKQPNATIDYWVAPMHKVQNNTINTNINAYDFDYINHLVKSNQYITNNYILGTNNTSTPELSNTVDTNGCWTKEIIGISGNKIDNQYKLPSVTISSRSCDFRVIYQVLSEKTDSDMYKESVAIDILFCGNPISYKMQDSSYDILSKIIGDDLAKRLVYQANENNKDLSLFIADSINGYEYVLCRSVKKDELHYAITFQYTDSKSLSIKESIFDDAYLPFKYKPGDIFSQGVYKNYNNDLSKNYNTFDFTNIKFSLSETQLENRTTYYLSDNNGMEYEIREVDGKITDIYVQLKITPNKSIELGNSIAEAEDIQKQFQSIFNEVEFIGSAQDIVNYAQNNKASQEIKVKKDGRWISGKIIYYLNDEKLPMYAIYKYTYTTSIASL